MASFTQEDDTGVDTEPNLSGYIRSKLSFSYLRGDETVDVYAAFTVHDTVTGQTAEGELTIEVIGQNDPPHLDGNNCGEGTQRPFRDKDVTEGTTVAFGNILSSFNDVECNFPLAYGTIDNGNSIIANPVLPLDVEGNNGGIFRFLVDGQVSFEQTGLFTVGQMSSINITIVDSEGAEGPLFPLMTTHIAPGPCCDGRGPV